MTVAVDLALPWSNLWSTIPLLSAATEDKTRLWPMECQHNLYTWFRWAHKSTWESAARASALGPSSSMTSCHIPLRHSVLIRCHVSLPLFIFCLHSEDTFPISICKNASCLRSWITALSRITASYQSLPTLLNPPPTYFPLQLRREEKAFSLIQITIISSTLSSFFFLNIMRNLKTRRIRYLFLWFPLCQILSGCLMNIHCI